MNHPSSVSINRIATGTGAASLLLRIGSLLLPLLCAGALDAQPSRMPETAVPRRPIYGVDLDEFFIGGVAATQHGNGPVDSLWIFGRELGIRYWELRNWEPERVDSLLAAPHDPGRERLILKNDPIAMAGHGREIILYPFDTVESHYWQNRFLERAEGTRAYNRAERGAGEMIYAAAGTRPNDTILKHIAHDHAPALQTLRYPEREGDTRARNTSGFVLPKRGDTVHIVVTGHLLPGGDAPHTEPVLAIDIWNEVPAGSTWLDSAGTVRKAGANRDFLYTTLYVRKMDLEPFEPVRDYDRFRSVTIPVDLNRNPGGMGGPLNDGNSAHGIDIRVRWTGAESVALRSIALRDQLGELMLGGGSASIRYRRSILDVARRMLQGDGRSPRRLAGTDPTIIRFYSGDEYGLAENRAFNALDSLLYTAFPTGDSLTLGVRAYHAQANHSHPSQHQLTSAGELTVETYIGDVRYAYFDPVQWYRLPDSIRQAPAIAQHNGGRFHLPLLWLDRAGVELYSRAMQRLHVGAYSTGYEQWPYNTPPKWANELGHAAWSSRRTGKRIIQWPGVHSAFLLQWKKNASGERYVDTTLSHINEASELRMAVNLGLAYGSRGVSYSWVGSQSDAFGPSDESGGRWDGTMHYDFYTDLGPVGDRVGIRGNHAPLLVLENRRLVPPARFTVPDFYLGWDNRLNEMKWLNLDWLPRIARAMARLQWRDGYSMHFAVTQRYMVDNTAGLPQTRSRPFPDTLIVRGIESYDRNGDRDPAEETFVELGLFDPWPGRSGAGRDALRDTNHIFLVNRRTFERPADIDPASDSGRAMDALAETRTLRIAFNVPRPDPSRPSMIRLREIEPDLTPLPGSRLARRPLDTVIADTGVALLTLRPGGGALLRITRVTGDMGEHGDRGMESSGRMAFRGSKAE